MPKNITPVMSKTVFLDIVIIVILSLAVMFRQLVIDGYFTVMNEDAFTYTSWAWQFKQSIAEGNIYPRWLPLNIHGHGSPTFLYYSPLAYYFVALLDCFTKSLVSSMNYLKFISLLLSSLGVYFLLKKYTTNIIALLSSCLYILFPYNIAQLYLFESFASKISTIWFAPIIFFISEYIDKNQFRHICYAGLCYAGLIATHIVNAYMFGIVIALYVTGRSFLNKRPKLLYILPAILVASLSFSAIYALPFIFEKKLIGITDGTSAKSSPPFFLYPDLTSKLPPDHFWTVYYHEYLINAVIIIFVLMLGSLTVVVIQKNLREEFKQLAIIFIVVAGLSLFLMTGLSEGIWEHVPYFSMIGFQGRWLNIAVFATVIVFASVFQALYSSRYKLFWRSAAVLLPLVACIPFDYSYITRPHIYTHQELMPVKGVDYIFDYLPANIPRNNIKLLDVPTDKASIIAGKGALELVEWESEKRKIKIRAEQDATLRINTFYFNGWKAYLDGKETVITTDNVTKVMLFSIPKGKHELKVVFTDTPIRFASKYITLIAISGVFLIITINKVFKTYLVYMASKFQFIHYSNE